MADTEVMASLSAVLAAWHEMEAAHMCGFGAPSDKMRKAVADLEESLWESRSPVVKPSAPTPLKAV